MTLREFHNALRILTSLDQHEVWEILEPHGERYEDFARDPFRWFIRASDEQVARMWAVIEARMGRRAAA